MASVAIDKISGMAFTKAGVCPMSMKSRSRLSRGREHALRKTPEGYIGDPGSASAEYGVRIVLETAELIANAIAARVNRNSQ